MEEADFEIDTNTFNDLEIFSAGSGFSSIYSLFKNTSTLGARELLTQIMKQPLSDINALNDRRDAIKYFYDNDIRLQISHNQVDLIEHYLTFNKRFLRDNPLDALYDHLSNRINMTPSYYIILTGIKNIIQILKVIGSIIPSAQADDAIPFLIKRGLSLGLLNDEILKKIISSNKKINFFEINHLDKLLRKTKISEVKEILGFIYEMDVFESVADIVKDKGWSFPIYKEHGSEINLDGLFHPGIIEPVVNSLTAGGSRKLVFLTGSNMAGKSSFLKSIGLSVYLAHLGFPVPAERMETSVFSGLITTINLPDNINDGLSHYYSEVKRIKYTALKLLEKKKLFVIFDELFRGTNPKDAYDASLLIIRALSQVPNCIFLISTHHAELADELRDLPAVFFKYFESSFEGEKLVYSYKLLDGVSYERSGMHIMQSEGVLEILGKAKDMSNTH